MFDYWLMFGLFLNVPRGTLEAKQKSGGTFYDSAHAPKQDKRGQNGNGIFAHGLHLQSICTRRTPAQKRAAADSMRYGVVTFPPRRAARVVLFFMGNLLPILYTMIFHRYIAIHAHILNKVCQAHKTPVFIGILTENSPKKFFSLVIFFLDKSFQQRFFGNILHNQVEKPLKNLYNSHKKLFRQSAQSRV